MKKLAYISAILAPFVVVIYIVTFWALTKSQERTACYKTAKQASDCEQPGAIESFVRWALK